MTERSTGRHRACQKKPSTPLSTLTGSLSVVSDYVGGSVRRSGVIIAMSSGLVASMALPAHAVTTSPESVGSTTASVPLSPGTAAGEALFAAPEGGLLALPPDLVTDEGAVAAPAAAAIDFDHPSFSVGAGTGTDPFGLTGGTNSSAPSAPAAGQDDKGDKGDKGSDAPAPATRKERRQAETPSTSSSGDAADTGTTSAVPASSGTGSKAVSVAFRYQGVGYVWGGTSPRGFDCSGFTQYVYKQLGKSLGRTVADQRGDVRFVSRSQAKPGDLVFFSSSHVGVYLGNNQMIDAPRRGKTIQPRKIYSSNVQFGRVV